MTEEDVKVLSEAFASVLHDVVRQEVDAVLKTVVETELRLQKDLGGLGQRVAVVETREPEPGPAGPAGPPGADGKDGKPGLRYRYVWKPDTDDGQGPYVKGDLVTYNGGGWHCNVDGTTGKPGETKDWSLFVKPGRDFGHRGK